MNQNTTIDELKTEIQHLKKERQEYLSLFDSGEVALFKWNNDDTWSTAYASQNVLNIFGYSAEEFLNKSIDYSDLIHPDDFDTVYKEVVGAIENDIGYFTHTSYRIITRSKSVKWILDNVYMLRDEKGVVTHFLGTISDITKLKEYESSLESMVKEKTNEISIQKDILYQQNRFTTIGETIQSISHQWRQPLNHIGANISKLEMLNEKNFQNQDIHTIVKNTNNSLEYMSKTINDFNNYFSASKEKSHFKILDTFYEAVNIITPSLKNLDIYIYLEVEDKNLKINSFANDLVQVILILLNNAIDAILKRKEKENIKGEIILSLNKSDGKINIALRDNGTGIDKKIINKIYEPYFTTKFKAQGTGIGLYMCKMIVEKEMQASIKCTQNTKGVTFNIIFNV